MTTPASAQSVLFDFENAPIHTSLPIDLTVNGITARFSATGQGMSIQPANTYYSPVGFSGLCVFPSSIYASDLHVSFSQKMKDFSILYAPHELACDTSATMRVTAYSNGFPVGTATTNAQPGTWPSETLAISVAQGFDSVVVHYDSAPAPPPCDYGVIFMADNMLVTPAPVPPTLNISQIGNQVEISWPTNTPGFALQCNSNASSGGIWIAVTNTPAINVNLNIVTLPMGTNAVFYRLKQ